MAKIDPRVAAALADNREADFLVLLDRASGPSLEASGVDSSGVGAGSTTATGALRRSQAGRDALRAPAAQRARVVAAIHENGAEALAPVERELARLSNAGHVSAVERFLASGVLAVKGDQEALERISALPAVAEVRADRVHWLPAHRTVARSRSEEPFYCGIMGRPTTEWSAGGLLSQLPVGRVSWNLALIRAPRVWDELGCTGQGAVVATIDTGVDVKHPALRNRYRGRNGDHHYDWYDVTRRGPILRQPADPHGHGTHIAGIIGGYDPGALWGVAPEAEWVAVRAFDERGISRDSWLLRAGEWVLAPTDLNGENPRPDLAADVINCSWVLENPADPLYGGLIEAWRAAGIVSVFAAGNDDDATGTTGAVRAPGTQPSALSVGAVDSEGVVWARSRSGPGYYGGVKPDLTAPGVGVESAAPGGGTATYDGTSMAAAHVSGAAALLLASAPHLTAEDVAGFLRRSATDQGAPGPDSRYGYGVLDTYHGVRQAFVAGRVAGVIVDGDGIPLSGVQVTVGQSSGTTTTDDSGSYDLAAPAGRWLVSAAGFGFVTRSAHVSVADDVTTRLDLVLQRQRGATVSGTVGSATGGSIVGARVSAAGGAALAVTGPDGSYRLPLPEGGYVLRASAMAHRSVTTTLAIQAGRDTAADFVLPPAPRLLLVDADAWDEERIYPYVSEPLALAGYDFDVLEFDDIESPLASGIGQVLAEYDAVVWCHNFGSPGQIDFRRTDRRLTDALAEYVSRGGNLLLTGQDVGYRDAAGGPLSLRYAPAFYRQILGAEFLVDDVSSDVVRGLGLLSGVALELSAPRRHPKGRRLAPDAVSPADRDGTSQPSIVLRYSDGRAAGLAVDDGIGRRLYLSFGLESAGPVVEVARLLDRAVAWLERPSLAIVAPYRGLSVSVTTPLSVTLRAGRSEAPCDLRIAAADGLTLVAGSDELVPDGEGALEWSGNLQPREVRPFAVLARLSEPIPGGESLVVTATLAAQGRETSDTLLLAPDTPDLRTSELGVVPERLAAAGPVTTSLLISNTGRTAASASALLGVPAAMQVATPTLRASAGVAEWVPGQRAATWRGDLPVGAGATVVLSGRLPDGIGAVHQFTATLAEGSGVLYGPEGASGAGVAVGPGGGVELRASALVGGPDLAASRLTPARTTVDAGAAVTLTLRLRNDGPSDASASAIALLPLGLAAPPDSEWAADPDARTLAWTGVLGPGAQRLLPLPLRALEQSRGEYRVTVRLSDGRRPEAPVQVGSLVQVRRGDPAASLTALLPGRVRSGEAVTGTVLVANHGDAPLAAQVSDFLPAVLVVEPGSVRVSEGKTSLAPGAVNWAVNVDPPVGPYTWTLQSRSISSAIGESAVGPCSDDDEGPATPQYAACDDSAVVELGMAFPFYSGAYTRAVATGDGLLRFGGPFDGPPPEGQLPDGPAVAAYWRREACGLLPTILRAPGRTRISWPGESADASVVLELAQDGDMRLEYGPRLGSDEAIVGLHDGVTWTLQVPTAVVAPNHAIDISAPGGWQWLRYRSRLATSLAPNTLVTHTVEISGSGGTRRLVSGLVANRLSIDGSRLRSWPTTPVAGGDLHGSLTLRTSGDVEARGVTSRVALPSALEVANLELSEGLRSDPHTGELLWQGRLAPGEKRELRWTAPIGAGTAVGVPLLTRATITAPGLAPLLLAREVRVAATDLSGSRKWSWRPVAWPGEVVTFTLRAENAGPMPAAVTVTDALPPELELIAGSIAVSAGPDPEWDEVSRSIRWLGKLTPQSAAEITFGTIYEGPGRATNVMILTDEGGTRYSSWAHVLPAVKRLFLPWACQGR